MPCPFQTWLICRVNFRGPPHWIMVIKFWSDDRSTTYRSVWINKSQKPVAEPNVFVLKRQDHFSLEQVPSTSACPIQHNLEYRANTRICVNPMILVFSWQIVVSQWFGQTQRWKVWFLKTLPMSHSNAKHNPTTWFAADCFKKNVQSEIQSLHWKESPVKTPHCASICPM